MEDTIERVYKQTNELAQATMETFLSFLKILADNIYDHISYAPYKHLAQWIKEGGTCKIYQVRAAKGQLDSVVRQMRRHIENQQLGAIRIYDSGLFIVPEPHLKDIQEINRSILLERCNYYQEADLKEMEDAITHLPPLFDKDVLVLKGISKYEAEVIKNKSNVITKGFMVGISSPRPDGTYNLGVRTDKVFLTNLSKGKSDFCKASLNALVSLYGVNHAKKIEELNNDAHMDNVIYSAADDAEVKYIVERSRKHYIEISSAGFSKYTMQQKEDGHFVGVLENRVERSDVNFFSELEIQLDEFLDEKLLKNIDELNDYLATGPDRTPFELLPRYQDANIQRNLVDVMDKMIKSRMISNDCFALLNANAKYNCYMREASALLMQLSKSKEEMTPPEGYTQEQMNMLAATLNSGWRQYGDMNGSKENKTVLSRVAAKVYNITTEQYHARALTEQEKAILRKERDSVKNFNIENR